MSLSGEYSSRSSLIHNLLDNHDNSLQTFCLALDIPEESTKQTQSCNTCIRHLLQMKMAQLHDQVSLDIHTPRLIIRDVKPSEFEQYRSIWNDHKNNSFDAVSNTDMTTAELLACLGYVQSLGGSICLVLCPDMPHGYEHLRVDDNLVALGWIMMVVPKAGEKAREFGGLYSS